jgi:tetratricopeptide (TPR) repeat protein
MCCGPALADEACTLDLLETSAAKTVSACTAVLNRDSMDKTSRTDALKIRGRALQRLNRNDEAISDYEAGLRLAPDDAELHLRRGWTAYDELRRGSRAAAGLMDDNLNRIYNFVVDQAQQALKLKPDYAEAYYEIAVATQLADRKSFTPTKALYDQAIRLEPDNPNYRFSRLMLLDAHGYSAEAIEEADAILKLPAASITKPSAVDFSQKTTTGRIATAMERGRLLESVGRMDEARRAYDRAVDIDPDAITFAERAGFKLSQLTFYPGMPTPPLDSIQEDLTKALALDPDYWFAHQQQAQLYFVREEYDKAAAELASALKSFPDGGRLRWRYATMLRNLGRSEDAQTEALKAFQMDPGFMFGKLGALKKIGYLVDIAPNADPWSAIQDAVRACMLDERCD